MGKASFKNIVNHGLVLHMQETLTLNLEMEMGSAVENITVEAEVEAIDTTKSEVSNVITENQVRDLPPNQRSLTALVTQQPGLVTMTNATGLSQPSGRTLSEPAIPCSYVNGQPYYGTVNQQCGSIAQAIINYYQPATITVLKGCGRRICWRTGAKA